MAISSSVRPTATRPTNSLSPSDSLVVSLSLLFIITSCAFSFDEVQSERHLYGSCQAVPTEEHFHSSQLMVRETPRLS